MKKKVFYLDFIRVISMFIIVTYHFFAHFTENNIDGIKILSNGKWGMIGVTMFFMISGAALMYNYGNNMDIKKYAKKRFLGIYPMFWIAYVLIYIYFFYTTKSVIGSDIPKYKLIISLFAMDGYLSPYTKTIYLIGEWFLGCIVLIYILFPVLRKIMNNYPKIFFCIFTVINFVMILFYRNSIMTINKNLIVCSYSFVLGMYIIKYIDNLKLWQMLIAFITSIVVYFIPIQNNDINMQTLIANIVGYCLFIVMAYIGQKTSNSIIQKVFSEISKYSYAIFLVHHYIIMKIESSFTNSVLQFSGTVLLYLTCWVTILICAKILYIINNKIINLLKKENKTKFLN